MTDKATQRMRLIIVRHGETEWTLTGRYTGATDVGQTTNGRHEAAAMSSLLQRVLHDQRAAVVSSPLRRATETAALALPDYRVSVDPLVAEYDYGEFEGLTTGQIHQLAPGWDIWRDGCPGGESTEDVGRRADTFLRLYLGETNEMIARKLQTAFAHGLTPILRIGDTAAEHRAGRSEVAVRAQLEVLLCAYRLSGGPFLVAYEPAWAISTSDHPVDCTPQEAGDRHGFIRSTIAGELGAELAAGTTLLYGGSVTADNADDYFTQPDIDGGLVGTASQDLASFQALITATLGTYQHPQPAAGH